MAYARLEAMVKKKKKLRRDGLQCCMFSREDSFVQYLQQY
jgi:hypothetical protein